jgi:tetratricopeptide (TPR) repeat protein
MLPAQLEYAAAVSAIQAGDLDEAEGRLRRAIELDPGMPDPYFTLAKVDFRQFDPDALYFLVTGFKVAARNFHVQGLFAVNALLVIALLLVMVSTIVCIAFAIRYLPFVAYRLSEILQARFNAVAPRATAMLILMVPFALLPGFVSGMSILLVMTWYFMHKREKAVMFVLMLPLVALAVLAPRLERVAPLSDPGSFVSLSAQGVHSAGDSGLIGAIEAVPAEGLEAEKYNALGILHLRRENYEAAASLFLRAISVRPDDPVAYINLGNVYYLQEMYDKALEGYRKAEQLAPADAVGQYNLAQAYIKTLLLAESSKALKNASVAGIESVKQSFAVPARAEIQVYPRTYGAAELWRIAAREGAAAGADVVDAVLAPLVRMPVRSAAWIMLAALVVAIAMGRAIKPRHLAFQCSNCGDLTSESSCNDERGAYICARCAGAIAGVSSDKVIDALLRQRRQAVLVRRRRAIRLLTMWIPGVRDVFYGKLSRGLVLATLFSLSVVQIVARGFIVEDWHVIEFATPLWKWILPAVGIVIAYAASIFSKQYLEVRNYRTPTLRRGSARDDEGVRTASA